MAQSNSGNGGRKKPPVKRNTTAKKPTQTRKRRTTKKKQTKKSNLPVYLYSGILVIILVVLSTIYLLNKASSPKAETEKPAKKQIVIKTEKKPEIKIVKRVSQEEKLKEALLIAQDAVINTYDKLDVSKEARKAFIKTKNEIRAAAEAGSALKDELIKELSELLGKQGFTITTDKGFKAEKDGAVLTMLILTPEPVKPEVVVTTPSDKKWNRAKISIVIDDCGYSEILAQKLADIKYPLTFAIIPHLPKVRETYDIARKAGKPVFLHQPMQPVSYPKTDPGKGAIFVNMPSQLIEVTLDKNIKNIGRVDGFNNHMGSAATQDTEAMTTTLKHMKQYTNVFFDSHTSKKTVGYKICRQLGMKCALNTTYLDNVNEEDKIYAKLVECANRAEKSKNGECIIIGHLRPKTVKVLAEKLPMLDKQGVKVMSILDMVK